MDYEKIILLSVVYVYFLKFFVYIYRDLIFVNNMKIV